MNINMVSTILGNGKIIGTRCRMEIFWHKNIIYNLKGEKITTGLPNNYVEGMITAGSDFFCKFNTEFFEYIFQGRVIEIKSGSPSYIVLKIDRAEEIINTRQYPRYDVYIPMKLSSTWDKDEYYAIVSNICEGGAAFVSSTRFDNGEDIRMRMQVDGATQISLYAKIIRVNTKSGSYEYSIKFSEIEEDDLQKIHKILSENQDEEARLYDYYERYVKGKL